MACYNFDTQEQILIFFGRDVIDKVGNQKMPPQVTCASALPGKTGKYENHIFHSNDVLVESAAAISILCCTHSAPVRCLPERKIVISRVPCTKVLSQEIQIFQDTSFCVLQVLPRNFTNKLWQLCIDFYTIRSSLKVLSNCVF